MSEIWVVRRLARHETAKKLVDIFAIDAERERSGRCCFVAGFDGKRGRDTNAVFRRVNQIEEAPLDYWQISDMNGEDYSWAAVMTPISVAEAHRILSAGKKSSAPNCPICKKEGRI